MLKVEKMPNIFNGLETLEYIDTGILERLLRSDLLQTVAYKSFGSDVEYENEKAFLTHIQKKVKNNKLKVVYKDTKIGYGRVNPVKSLSLCCMRRAIRHTLAKNYYVDIDIENCHPQLLLQLCKKHPNIFESHEKLEDYVINREARLQEVMDFYGVTRTQAKNLFIILLYGGSFKTWAENHNLINVQASAYIFSFEAEFRDIATEITKHNTHIQRLIVKQDPTKTNIEGSVVSAVLQEYERRVLESVYTFLKNKGLNLNDCVLCYDGLMVEKQIFNLEFLNEFSIEVFNKTGFNLTFTTKEMDEDYLNILDEINENPCSFESVCAEFEKTHCKIINSSLYITQSGDNIILMSKKNLVTSYEHLTYKKYNKDGQLQEYNFINSWATNNPKIRAYDDIGIYPPNGELCPPNIFNMWKPFDMELVDNYEHKQKELDVILNHIRILCNHEEVVYDYFIKWIAQMIQYPATKTICPTLISSEGAGKGSLVQLLEKMLGTKKVFMTTEPSKNVWGSFNHLMADSFLVNLNELSKKDSLEAEGKIKGLITDSSLTINGKGINQYNIKSCHRFIITTNKEDPIKTSTDDRRNLIIRSSDEKVGDKKYFKYLQSIIDDVNVAKTVYEYFKSIPDMDKFHQLVKPTTQHQENLKELSVSPIESWVKELVQENIDKSNVSITSSDAFKMFCFWCSENKVEYNLSSLQFQVRLSNSKLNGITSVKGRTSNTKVFDINILKKHFNLDLIELFNDDE